MSLDSISKPKLGKIPNRVLVVSGASGGHIFPALAFLEKLKEKHGAVEALLVLPQSFCGIETVKEKDEVGYNIEYLSISAIKLSSGLRGIISIVNFFKGALKSAWLLVKFSPDVVVAFGSIVSVPLVFFAWIFRIKTILHEQNLIPGRANRFLSKIADRMAISFPESQRYLDLGPNRTVFTGNPLRAALRETKKQEALDFFGLDKKKFTILVTGGSQGSRKINFCFRQAFCELSAREDLQVIHLTGKKDYLSLKEAYKDFQMQVKLFDFLKEMRYAYSASDLIVTRAGATTISEIIFFKLPAIIIPYPFAYQHQLANARILEERKAAVIIEDSLLDERVLKDSLEHLLNNRRQLEDMSLALQCLYVPGSAERLVESALSLYK